MSTLDTRDAYVGVGNTLLRLVEGLVGLKAVDPNDNPRPQEALDEAVLELEGVQSVEGLPLATLKLIRLGIAMGVRPTAGDVPEDVITAEVGPGLELLAALESDKERNLSVRMVAMAVSVLFDYVFAICEPAMEHLSREEQEATVRAAILIAETSVRRIDATERAALGVKVLRDTAEALESLIAEEEQVNDE
jgi:hypothetical protein